MDGLDWEPLLPKSFAAPPPTQPAAISFSTSRPADDLFPWRNLGGLRKR